MSTEAAIVDHATTYRDIGRESGVEALPDVPIGPYTTMKVGGNASWLFEPRTPSEAARLFGLLCDAPLPVYLLGAGSNVLVDDGGIDAAVIATAGLRGDPVDLGDGRVSAQAGTGVPGLVRWSSRHGRRRS